MPTRPIAHKMLLAGLLAFGLCLPMAAWSQEPNGIPLPPGTLTAAEIRSLFSDKTVYSVTAAKGRESVSYYSATGEVRQQRKNITRSGHWHVTESDRMCLQMEDLPEKCRIVVKEGESYSKYIVKKSGRHQLSIRYTAFVEGNPLGL